ncbi:MAG: GNAT family N-acetyltransferase [Litorilinea sp.]
MPSISADSPGTPASVVPADARTVIRPFTLADAPHAIPHIVEFWNCAYRDQRNFQPLTPEIFQRRILDCPAFVPEGLRLAWAESARPAEPGEAETRALVGMVHAFRAQPATGVYTRWGAQPGIAHLHVLPAWRRQGIGSRLLQSAENWLYYCPVYVGAAGQACYGAVEGPRAPLFGSTQALAINAQDGATLQFFARHGYRVYEPGDVSLRLEMAQPPAPSATATPDLPKGMRVIEVSHRHPYTGEEPPGRAEYSLWGDNRGDPYTALLIVDDAQRLFGHIGWYPMARAQHTAICSFWLAPQLRGRRAGAWLLDAALQRIYHAPSPEGGMKAVEVHTHSVRHPVATHLYEARGFRLEAAWAALVKM